MSILTNIVAAEDDEIEAIGESLGPIEEWSGIAMRDFDTAKIATLHCLLTGDLFDDALGHYEPIYISDAEGALVLRLADEVMERLASIEDDALEDMAAELAATEEFEATGWDIDSIFGMLESLIELARIAESQGQALFVWMHPLRS